jgi:ferredoxin-NADP reductase
VPLATFPLLEVVPATPRSRLVTIDVSANPFHFLPGQAVLVGTHGHKGRRPYSIASSPERAFESGRLELLVAVEADGGLGPHLASLEPGTPLDVEGPLGTFVFPKEPGQPHLLFIAGGTGISPLRAMIDHVLRQPARQAVSLLYSARRGDEFAFIDELSTYAAAGRIELHRTVTRDDSTTWSGGRGRIGRRHFEPVLHDPAATLCFVCGPRAMVSASTATLRELGVPEDAILTEGWARP